MWKSNDTLESSIGMIKRGQNAETMIGFKYIKDKNNLSAFLLFWVVFLLVFLQYPLKGSLPGDLDTWCNLSLYNSLKNCILDWFSGTHSGVFNYPTENLWANYGFNFFAGAIFLVFKVIGMPDLWAYYFFITLVLALNSFAVYKLCTLYVPVGIFCLFAGLIFSLSNFMLGNIDNPNIISIFPGILALYFLQKLLINGGIAQLKYFMYAFTIQVVIGTVPAVVFFIAYGVLVVLNARRFIEVLKGNIAQLVVPILVFFIASTPWIYYCIIVDTCRQNYNVVRGLWFTHILSLNLEDFTRVLPNNLLYKFRSDYPYFFKCAFPGVSLLLFSIIGLFSSRGKQRELALLLVLGIFFSMGPYICYQNTELFKSPLYLLYKIIPVYDFFRVPARAYFLGLLALTVLFCIGWYRLYNFGNSGLKLLTFIVPIFVLAENMPFSFVTYSSNKVLSPDIEYIQQLKAPAIKIVLNLPSTILSGYVTGQREYWYSYWQTIYRKDCINGIPAYINPERLRNDSLCRNIGKENALKELVVRNNIDVIVFHTDLCVDEESGQLNVLLNSPFLVAVETKGPKKFFKVVQKAL